MKKEGTKIFVISGTLAVHSHVCTYYYGDLMVSDPEKKACTYRSTLSQAIVEVYVSVANRA